MKKKILLTIALSVTFFNFAQTPCENGFALNYPCQDYDLQSHLFLAEMGASDGNDSWGWTDPDDGTEYALVGL